MLNILDVQREFVEVLYRPAAKIYKLFVLCDECIDPIR